MKNKKIAIMTWYTYNNYGSVLQAYALRQKIKDYDYDIVDMVNYEPHIQNTTLLEKITVKNIKRKLLYRQEEVNHLVNEKNMKFDNFRNNNFTFTTKCNDATELFLLNDQYDKFICGSDQIWAPTVFDENYFLSFVNNDDKKISYAPSIGLPIIENRYIAEEIKGLIEKIENLSIREEQGKDIIKELTGKSAEVVLDPTLLLTKQEWNERFKLQQLPKDEYILFYCLSGSKKDYKIAKKISKKLRKKLKIIPSDVFDYKKDGVENVSPEEFLKLIYNAYMVITDSFHGTIFSINFNIPFITLKRFKDNKLSQNSRIYNILKKVKLEQRIYDNNIKYFLDNLDVSFLECNKIIEKERRNSIEFLIKALEKENNKKTTKITNLCTGCGMCAAVCPKKCINIKLNNQGFYSYEIDKEKCINCNMCKKVCGQLNADLNEMKDMKLYSAYSLNEEVLKKSSSGGIAYEISLYGIQRKIPVIGCTYNTKKDRAEHIKITTKEDLIKISGSKYLQSYTIDAFKEIKNMQNGIIIGTPCQIASIDRYLKNNNKRDNFILVDLICHGVPSYYVWKKYMRKFKKINEVKFRDKSYGWRNMTININSEYHKKEDKDLFYDVFRTGVAYNKSCYECKYRTKTLADIRLGDYWGTKFENNRNGVSMVIVNTKRGQDVLNELVEKKKITMKSQPITDYFNIQQTVNNGIPKLYNQIIDELKNDDIRLKDISYKYCKNILREDKLKRVIFKIYRKVAKK